MKQNKVKVTLSINRVLRDACRCNNVNMSELLENTIVNEILCGRIKSIG